MVSGKSCWTIGVWSYLSQINIIYVYPDFARYWEWIVSRKHWFGTPQNIWLVWLPHWRNCLWPSPIIDHPLTCYNVDHDIALRPFLAVFTTINTLSLACVQRLQPLWFYRQHCSCNHTSTWDNFPPFIPPFCFRLLAVYYRILRFHRRIGLYSDLARLSGNVGGRITFIGDSE